MLCITLKHRSLHHSDSTREKYFIKFCLLMLQVSANAGIVTMTQEHLNLLVALELPFFIVVTKVDVTSRQKFQDTIDALKKVLASVGMHKVTKKIVLLFF